MRLTTVLLAVVLALPTHAAQAGTIQLPKTGQTRCWDIAGTIIDCAGTGHDGETQLGRDWPSPRFSDNGNGTLTDTMTGLVWLKNANCFGTLAWQQALDAANALASGSCGLTDGSAAGQWRLPNRKELLSISSQNVSDGGAWLNSQGFVNGLHTYYWTSDTDLKYVGERWMVHPVGAAYPESWNLPIGGRLVMPVRNPAQVTLTATTAGGSGDVTSPNPLTVAYGAAATFTAVAAPGYRLDTSAAGTCQPGSFVGNVYDLGVATADCSVNFFFSPLTYLIATSATGSGAITCVPSSAVGYGTDVSCSAAATPDSHLDAVTVDGADQGAAGRNSFTYSFGPITADHTMTAAFAANSYTLTFTTAGNGSLTGKTNQAVGQNGTSSAVGAVAAPGYHFVNWTGDGGFMTTTANPLTIANVTTALTVTAHFAIDTHLVTPASAANGSIAPSLPQTVEYQGVTAFSLVPDTGYRVATATGCGGTLNGATYTTGAVTADCTVTVSFAPLTYAVVTTSSSGGRIDCAPGASVTYNGTVSCTAHADSGYHIVAVSVDGAHMVLSDPTSFTYPFTAVSANHDMQAVFAVNSYDVIFTAGNNGTLTGAAQQSVPHGGSTTAVTAVPATGYHFLGWTGSNTFTSAANPLVVDGVTGSMAFTAGFGIDTHQVTPQAASHGVITPAAVQTVNYGSAASFNLTPDTGYRIVSASGCAGVLNGTTYTTAPVTADCPVSAGFAAIFYPITGTCADDRGTINCTAEAVHGGTASCALAAKAGFHLAFLTDNGSDCLPSVANSSYTIAGITAAHTVAAGFATNSYTIVQVQAAYRSVLGQAQLSDADRGLFDIAPLGGDGRPAPDGVVDVADLIILLRQVVGAVTW
ncbi:DUF1566 domain-containing protein [Geomonas oryzisoli]|uniref:DUF1566 domain-containing protein n=1 Tax=Geomonas oryzisoli TaxID=2847992 RepID=A0ABX8J8Q8_9BACT|nr:DUF1566 domain-containing protein [Geomonas oryzisoli]QWV94728.1 DUF1566 domain-containing protein [Geomonas oryzisoli]